MQRRNLQPLESLLGELSQRCFATRWYNGMEWYGFRVMQGGPGRVGRGEITPRDVAELREAHEDLDEGWMLYPLHEHAAYIDKHRWMMAYGGGPDRVIQEVRRLERKLELAIDVEDHRRVDGLLQGTIRWY